MAQYVNICILKKRWGTQNVTVYKYFTLKTRTYFRCKNGSRKFRQGGAGNFLVINVFHRGPYDPILEGVRTSISKETYSPLWFSNGGSRIPVAPCGVSEYATVRDQHPPVAPRWSRTWVELSTSLSLFLSLSLSLNEQDNPKQQEKM